MPSRRPKLPVVSALVIEDDDDERELLAAAIVRAGYSVRTARNGREALDVLRSVGPAVIFVDLGMPVMSGAEFRQSQRRHRDWITIPTVVLMGTTDEPVLDSVIEQTLRKPV